MAHRLNYGTILIAIAGNPPPPPPQVRQLNISPVEILSAISFLFNDIPCCKGSSKILNQNVNIN